MTPKQQADLDTLVLRISKALAADDLESLCDYCQKLHDYAVMLCARVRQSHMVAKKRPYRIA